MTKAVYPIYLTVDAKEGGYIVYVPDFHNYTEGNDLSEAISMARDLIGSLGLCYEDEKRQIPVPFSEKYEPHENEIKTLVDINFEKYRISLDHKMVRKNCTIPYNLERKATELGLNFSKILSEALEERLKIV